MKPRVHDLDDAFAERNMFLQVSLGLISLCLRFEELVAANGTPLRQWQGDGRAPSASAASARISNREGGRRRGASEESPPVLRLHLPGQPPPAGAPATPAGPVLDFLLGLGAFSQRLLLHAEEASSPRRTDRSAAERRYSLRGLLA